MDTRYIAVEHGTSPTVTCKPMIAEFRKSRDHQTTESILSHLSRAFEASDHLVLIRTAINEPTSLRSFNIEEAELMVSTLVSFIKVLEQHSEERSKLSCTSLALANT